MRARKLLVHIPAALALACASCGSGMLGLAGLGGSKGAGPQDSPTVVGDVVVAGGSGRAALSPASFSFRLTDAEASPASVQVWLVPPSGAPQPAALTGAPTLAQLATSPGGVVHGASWDFAAQLVQGDAFSSGWRLEVRLAGASTGALSAPFDVGNDAPEISAVLAPGGPSAGPVQIDCVVRDSSADPVALTVEFENLAAPGWHAGTLVGQAPLALPTSPAGTTSSFFWDAATDEPGIEFQGRLRIRADDGLSTSAAFVSAPFLLDNNVAPNVSQLAVVGSTRSAPLELRFRLADPEGDPVDVELYATPAGGSPQPLALVGDTNLLGLAATPGGVVHTRFWDFASQLASGTAYATDFVLGARLLDGSSTVETLPFALGNDAPQIDALVVPSGTLAGAVQIDCTLRDSSSDPVSLLVEYDDLGDGAGWLPCTFAGPAPNALPTSPGGTVGSFLWDVPADEPGRELVARLRVTAEDGLASSAPLVSAPLAIDNDAAPLVSELTLLGSARSSPLSFSFRLSDLESDPADVVVLVTPPGESEVAALLVGDTSLAGLATAPGGQVHVRSWDFAGQLASGAGYASGALLRVVALDGGSTQSTPSFDVGNDAPVLSGLVVPSAPTSGIVPFALTASDSSADLLALTVEYRVPADGPAWHPATLAGAPPSAVASTPGGVALTLFWNAPADVPGRDVEAVLRVQADDGQLASAPVLSGAFALDGNSPPVVLLNGSAFLASADQRRGLALPYRVVDAEGDPVRVLFQWRTPYQAFPELPDEAAALDALLADPTARSVLQVAGEELVGWSGLAQALDASTLRLPELAGLAAPAVARGLVGRTFELLRAEGAPAPLASSWSANPLHAPAATLADLDPRAALVLDEPSVGSWRLARLDLASGVLLETVAQGAQGSPAAMAVARDPGHVLLAVELGGSWSVLSVALADGATHVLANGTSVLGTPRALVATGALSALVCVADALIALDWGAGTESVLLSGLASPAGLALDPNRSDRAFVAESAWIDPAPGAPPGRVLAFDLRTRELRRVLAGGFELARPSALAFDPLRRRLLLLCDANAADGALELCALALAGAEGGLGRELAAGLPIGARGLSCGADGRVVLALPGDDLAVAGGVEQTRAITALDPARAQVTLDAPLAPPPSGPRPWRVRPSASAAFAAPPGVEQCFVWRSSDLPQGGEVVLRAVPYDAQRGIAGDTGVPRTIRADLDVGARTVGGGAAMSGVTGIDLADLDGDGDEDLVTANVGADRLTVLFQTSPGSFGAAADVTLAGIPVLAPMTDPLAVRAVDVDSDGDLDLVSANRGSNNFTVALQTAPGSFSVQLLSLGLGGSAPNALAVGDLNGDGRSDLVTANGGTDSLTVFFQLLAGLYLPLPSLTLGAGATLAPSGVAVGDLDGDGDLDLVSSNEGSDTVTLFFQGAPGAFAAAPSRTLGGAGLTDGPSALALGDVDGDGRLDLAVANRDGQSVALFLQGAPGQFSATPSFVLSSALGPVSPRDVRLADLSGDGWLDVVALGGDGRVTLFPWLPLEGSFAPEPVSIDGGGSLSSPAALVAGDVDGDGRLDLALANTGAGNVALLVQQRGGLFAQSPERVLKRLPETAGASGAAVGDLDGDGDQDLALAAPTSGRVSLFEQFSPGVFGSSPSATLGSDATTAGVRALAAADLDGDLRVDLACACAGNGSLALFLQGTSGAFPTLPDHVLGGGALGGCAHVVAADLDGDGDRDLVCANAGDGDLAVFLQSGAGGFPLAPSQRLGAGSCAGASRVLAVDLDGDGSLEIVSANASAHTFTLFAPSAPGVWPTAPSATLGSAASTNAPADLAAADVDGDGDLDLIGACTGNDRLVVFLQANGTFPSSPSLVLTHAQLLDPSALAACDVDGDGDVDLVAGCAGSQRIALLRQLLPALFESAPETFGASGSTPATSCLLACDLDGDGDPDLIASEPTLGQAVLFFGSH